MEVVPLAYVPVMNRLKSMGGKPILRMAEKKAGPVVTDNGNFVIDVDFGVIESSKVEKLNLDLQQIVGIVETGLFVNMAEQAYFGDQEGNVTTRQK